MTFTDPVDFDAAIATIKEKELMPTDLGSAELSRLSTEIRQRSLFSAHTLNAQLLSGVQDELTKLTQGQSNIASSRTKVKELIDSLEANGETLTGMGEGEDSRINLVLKTNLGMARGKGQYDEGMQEGAIDAYPALELIRIGARRVPREWEEIWDEAADNLGDATTATDSSSGVLMALKGDPIWLEISDFGVPWPPFKFNSGMGVSDVAYEDAVAYGVMKPDEAAPKPEDLPFNEGIESSIESIASNLLPALESGLEGIATLAGTAFKMITGQKTLKNDTQEIRARVLEAISLLEYAA